VESLPISVNPKDVTKLLHAQAGGTVLLTLRFADGEGESRTAINLACGVIMAQNRCSQAEAMDILTKVSSNRNQKLRDVAAELIEQLTGDRVKTHFDA